MSGCDLRVVGKQSDTMLVDHLVEDDRLDASDSEWILIVRHCPKRSYVCGGGAKIGKADGRFAA